MQGKRKVWWLEIDIGANVGHWNKKLNSMNNAVTSLQAPQFARKAWQLYINIGVMLAIEIRVELHKQYCDMFMCNPVCECT